MKRKLEALYQTSDLCSASLIARACLSVVQEGRQDQVPEHLQRVRVRVWAGLHPAREQGRQGEVPKHQ